MQSKMHLRGTEIEINTLKGKHLSQKRTNSDENE